MDRKKKILNSSKTFFSLIHRNWEEQNSLLYVLLKSKKKIDQKFFLLPAKEYPLHLNKVSPLMSMKSFMLICLVLHTDLSVQLQIISVSCLISHFYGKLVLYLIAAICIYAPVFSKEPQELPYAIDYLMAGKLF